MCASVCNLNRIYPELLFLFRWRYYPHWNLFVTNKSPAYEVLIQIWQHSSEDSHRWY